MVEELQLDERRRELRIRLSDGGELALAPDAPEARGLSPGVVVSGAQREALEEAADRKRLARQIFELLGRRAYPRSVLHRKLLEKGGRAELIEKTLDECEREGLIDDSSYARLWCADQLRRKAVGRRWLHARLRQLGLAESAIRGAIDQELPREREPAEALRALGRRKEDLRQTKSRARALRFLMARGFDRATALHALELRRAELVNGVDPVAGKENGHEGEGP
jgi:SOS response regulatory protein OraA/RecX